MKKVMDNVWKIINRKNISLDKRVLEALAEKYDIPKATRRRKNLLKTSGTLLRVSVGITDNLCGYRVPLVLSDFIVGPEFVEKLLVCSQSVEQRQFLNKVLRLSGLAIELLQKFFVI